MILRAAAFATCLAVIACTPQPAEDDPDGAVPPPASTARADCAAPADPAELSPTQARALYDCFAATLHAAYLQGDKGWIPADRVSGYRNWTLASRVPFRAEAHGGRLAMVWANRAGAGAYLNGPAGGQLPPGALLALETFTVAEGEPAAGPLYFMEKTEPGVSPETQDWYFYAVGPDGAPIAVDVITACAACHIGEHSQQHGLGFPPTSARIGG